MKEQIKDTLLEMKPSQRRSEDKSNSNKKTKQHNNENDDTKLSWEEEKEIEEIDILDIDEEVNLYTDNDK